MDRRTLTMNWDGLGEDDDDDRFFESSSRSSSVAPLDLASSGSDDDEEFEDSRLSFTSCVSSASFASINTFKNIDGGLQSSSVLGDYGMWMAEPSDIKERRKRLLQGMGLTSSKELVKVASTVKVLPTVTARNIENDKEDSISKPDESSSPLPDTKQEPEPSPLPSTAIVLVRSRSEGEIEFFSLNTKKRKEELIGPVSKQRLIRTSSLYITQNVGLSHYANSVRMSPEVSRNRTRSTIPNSGDLSGLLPDGGFGSFFLIKNLDTGKEFIVKESNEKGMWNKLSDLETGKQLTMEEFEQSVGYSPVVKEMMRRENVSGNSDNIRKDQAHSYLSKSFRYSKRRGVALLKNIKGVANSMGGLIAEKEREQQQQQQHASTLDHHQKATKNTSQWVRVRQHGKPYKELTALHLSQEIQAHEGSIWTIKFSYDARYLASAGEDKAIHIWEVQECEVMPTCGLPDDLNSLAGTPVHPMAGGVSERPPLAEISPMPSGRKKGKHSSKKKGNSMPDYVNMPETVFGLSERPVCTLTGHLDDVLDLSWSREQLLLSSSTDKTVRLWDVETGSCLKLFAHNDYVTCIQFNPVDDDYFISGSLDAKIRIWNVTDRQVVDWTDLHEMVTSACYTPDGQGAIIGSHKGVARLYTIDDYKLEHKGLINIQNNKKSQTKKVTGIQFSPTNPTDVLITSADSRLRIAEGLEIIQKFKGFRNTSSQIPASFTPDGKYIISASEDNQVFMWKWEDPKNGAGKGGSRTTRIAPTSQAYEHFQCRDVSVAIPWPGSIKHDPPTVELHSKRHHSKRCTAPQTNMGSPTQEEGNSKRHQLPPLPKKEKDTNAHHERFSSCPDDVFAQSSPIDPGIGATNDSFMSASSSSIRYGESASISASANSPSQSWSSSWSLFDNGHGGHTVQATSWGVVIVAATVGGEIRVYQNFGLPLKTGRQANLFKDLA